MADRLAPESDVTGVVAEIERRFDVYKAHLRLISGFVPPAVNVDTVVIGAQESEDNAADWARALPGDVRSVRVRGDHYSFLDSPGVQEVAGSQAEVDPPAGDHDLLGRHAMMAMLKLKLSSTMAMH